MNFKLTTWHFQNLFLPMIEDEQGNLWCLSNTLATALGIAESTLRSNYNNNKRKFRGNCVHVMDAIEFVKQNKAALGLSYVRGDMHMWSDKEMVRLAILSDSENALEFQDAVVELVCQQARRGYVTAEQFADLNRRYEEREEELASLWEEHQRLKGLMGDFGERVEKAKISMRAALNAQKGTKILRGVN